MKHIALILALFTPHAALAENTPLQNFLKDLEEFGETLRPMMQDWALELAPLVEDLAGKIDDLSAYELPELLPNGDIIIRRKVPEPEPEIEAEPDGSIEL